MDSDSRLHILLPSRLVLENYKEIQNHLGRLNPEDPVLLDFSQVEQMDSTGAAMISYLNKTYPDIRCDGLSPRLKHMLDVFTGTDAPTPDSGEPAKTLPSSHWGESVKQFMVLMADEFAHVWHYLWRRRGVYPGEIHHQLFQMGYGSYWIVSVITFLVGVTIALTSAKQLNDFGANIFLADVVGFGMIRELVPLMTGIILAGKVGASITAEIASMKVLEEVDALHTMGLNPEKFLMVPRLIAIGLAVPLLVTLANIVGIFGGMLVGKFYSGISFKAFYQEMLTIVELDDVLIGLGKTLVFGWVIVISSGFKGFSVSRGALGVGIATTESVVLSISLIIVLDSIFALLMY
ncbi:MAG: ABC transporter permease [Candidatus Aminicenantes bacterium]|nr:ABC transporter permease [Candidatus Aminicenantes bacterium]